MTTSTTQALKTRDVSGNPHAALLASVLDRFGEPSQRAVLDVGCGHGERLDDAARRGWRCFGVEWADGPRKTAQQRLGEGAHIVAAVPDLFAHTFDLVLVLDILAHLSSPETVFHELFSVGAIAQETTVVVTSASGRFTAASLRDLLKHLRFSTVDVQEQGATLVATAKGSDFQSFMHERYVPGTWSKIAAYEHVPRYCLARPLAQGKAVLDFGCGTGYGAAMLAETAAAVTGLDIDESALVFARETHRAANLSFQRHDDLGATLPAASFDLVTCFEMIEHVDFSTQQRTIASIARLLRDDGLLLISTPNPEITKLYGANPYHVREMSEAELQSLLAPSFPHVRIVGQHVHPGITFSAGEASGTLKAATLPGDGAASEPPMAFIALCSRRPLPALPDQVFFDAASNYVGTFVGQGEKLQIARAETYSERARAIAVEAQYRILAGQHQETVTVLNQTTADLHQTRQAKDAMEHARNLAEQSAAKRAEELRILNALRQDELSSPRFLARQLWQATRARVRAILRARFSRD